MLELNFSPFPELRTERLFLRKLTKNDAKEIFFLRSNEDVLHYIGREPAKSIAGFVKEGHLRENFYFKGEFSDTLIYSRLK